MPEIFAWRVFQDDYCVHGQAKDRHLADTMYFLLFNHAAKHLPCVMHGKPFCKNFHVIY